MIMKKYLSLWILSLSALICTVPAYAAGSQVQVAIKDFGFSPATLTVSAGTTVTWTNYDDDPHTVADRGSPQVFRSSALDTQGKFSYTFTTPGAYAYFCTLHPHMVGKVIVTGAGMGSGVGTTHGG